MKKLFIVLFMGLSLQSVLGMEKKEEVITIDEGGKTSDQPPLEISGKEIKDAYGNFGKLLEFSRKSPSAEEQIIILSKKNPIEKIILKNEFSTKENFKELLKDLRDADFDLSIKFHPDMSSEQIIRVLNSVKHPAKAIFSSDDFAKLFHVSQNSEFAKEQIVALSKNDPIKKVISKEELDRIDFDDLLEKLRETTFDLGIKFHPDMDEKQIAQVLGAVKNLKIAVFNNVGALRPDHFTSLINVEKLFLIGTFDVLKASIKEENKNVDTIIDSMIDAVFRLKNIKVLDLSKNEFTKSQEEKIQAKEKEHSKINVRTQKLVERAEKFRLGKLLDVLPYELHMNILTSIENEFVTKNNESNFDWFFEYSNANETQRKAVYTFSKPKVPESQPINITIRQEWLSETEFPKFLKKMEATTFYIAVKFHSAMTREHYRQFFDVVSKPKVVRVSKEVKDKNELVALDAIVGKSSSFLVNPFAFLVSKVTLDPHKEAYKEYIKKYVVKDFNRDDFIAYYDQKTKVFALQYPLLGNDCSNNLRGITNGDVAWIIDAVKSGKASNVTSLDLGYNEIGPEKAKAIADNMPQIISLDLSGNHIGDKEVKDIAAKMPQIINLDLGGNHIGPEGATAIAANMPQVITLDLSHNRIGPEGATAIAANMPHVKNLNLDGNKIGDEGATEIAAKMTKVTTLNLSLNNIGPKGAAAIAATMTNVKNLNLDGNNIGDEGAKDIATMTNVKNLNLDGNDIGPKGATAIAANMPQVITLDLSGNDIGDTGATAIAANMTNVATLNLSYNNIGAAGAEDIATMTNVKKLDLSYNNIGDTGAKAIADNMPQVTTLNLSFNRIGGAGAKDIANAMKSGKVPELSTLNLSNNNIGDEGAKALADAIAYLRKKLPNTNITF
jgi:Ran GTPase-activating protein (RanGAP) involved in mRNA processing and transport